MSPEAVIDIVRHALLIAVWTMGPLMILGMVVGVIINVIQVATSLQDSAFSTVPRLAVFMAAFAFLMPWMLTKLMAYTTSLFGDLGRYAR